MEWAQARPRKSSAERSVHAVVPSSANLSSLADLVSPVASLPIRSLSPKMERFHLQFVSDVRGTFQTSRMTAVVNPLSLCSPLDSTAL